MRRIKVGAYEKALVFKNNRLVDILEEGKHWIWFGRKVKLYDVTEVFYHDQELDLLMENPQFAEMTDIVWVGDNNITIQFKKGNFYNVLTSGVYCYWKDGVNYENVTVDLNDPESAMNWKFSKKVLTHPVIANYIDVFVVESYEKGLMYVDGKVNKQVGPGVYYFWKGDKPIFIKKVDMRKQTLEVSGQELLTKDKASVRINFYAYFKVSDVTKAIDETKDYARQLYILIQLGLREYVGKYSLDELLENKMEVSPYVNEYVKFKADSIGVDFMDSGIRDIILPGEMKEIMNHVLVAEKKAQANVIMRREETASTRSLLNTAKLMEDNEMLFRLKEMEYIEKISEKIGEITVNGGGQIMDQLRTLVGYNDESRS